MTDRLLTLGLPASLERVALARPARLLGWLALATALGGTFWLYTRPDFLLDMGALFALCGIAL